MRNKKHSSRAANNAETFNLYDYAETDGDQPESGKKRRWDRASGFARFLAYFGIILGLIAFFLLAEVVIYLVSHIVLLRYGLLAFTVLALLVVWLCYIRLPLKHRKAHRVASIFVSLLLVACMVCCIVTPWWNWLDACITKVIYMYDPSLAGLTDDELGITGKFDSDVINIALFGLDSRNANLKEGEKLTGLSDSIMVMSLNVKKHSVKLVSVVRDSLVPIEGLSSGYNKINAAYSTGGAKRAVQTLNKTFKLNIREYATVNFYGMAEIIDEMGGIDVELTDAEVQPANVNQYCINGTIHEICKHLGKKPRDYYVKKSGKQHLNGIQAVGYARIRHVANVWGTNNDYGRTERQRYVMEQLFNKAIKMRGDKYPGLAKTLLPYTQTSLTLSEIVSLANAVLLKSPTFEKANMPYIDYNKGFNMRMTAPTSAYGSVEYYDIDYAAKIMHAFFYKDVTFEEYATKNGVETHDWYTYGRISQSSSDETTVSNTANYYNPGTSGNQTNTTSSTASRPKTIRVDVTNKGGKTDKKDNTSAKTGKTDPSTGDKKNNGKNPAVNSETNTGGNESQDPENNVDPSVTEPDPSEGTESGNVNPPAPGPTESTDSGQTTEGNDPATPEPADDNSSATTTSE